MTAGASAENPTTSSIPGSLGSAMVNSVAVIPTTHLDRGVDRAPRIGLQAPVDACRVVDRELARGDVVGPGVDAEHQEALQPRPVIERERLAARVVGGLRGAGDRLALWGGPDAEAAEQAHGGPPDADRLRAWSRAPEHA